MKTTILKFLSIVRAPIMRSIKPKAGYKLFKFNEKRSLEPISQKFGFDRGTPVDRYYIEEFLEENKDFIKGECLEIHNNYYTNKFGGSNVTKADALDIDTNNKLANIYGDLRDLKDIPSNSYDCLIITHTLGVIDEYMKAISECKRILKPGGTVLCTVSSMGVALEVDNCFWRFTPTSAKYSFDKFFNPEKVEVKSKGNVLSGQAFWVGLSIEELSKEELEHNDPRFAIIVTIRATKEN